MSIISILETAHQNNHHVIITLTGGVSYSGKVKEITNHEIIQIDATGKEFYNTFIVASQIISIEVKK
jgi:hypothetical protein